MVNAIGGTRRWTNSSEDESYAGAAPVPHGVRMQRSTVARDGYRRVLGVGEFRVLFAALTVSMAGTVLASLALAVLVYERTRSPALSALTFAFGFIPYLVGGVLLSGLADRVPPRALMTTCDLLRACLFAAMAVPGVPVTVLLALLFAGGLIAPVFSGAQSALLPDILGEGDGYVLGRSLLRIVAQSTQILGYALGGVLLLIVAPRTMLIIDALSFIASAALIRLLIERRPARARARVASAGHGLRIMWRNPALRRLLAFQALVPAFAVVPEALAIPYVTDLGRPAAAAGLLLWALPAGTITGELLAGRFVADDRRRRLIVPFAAVVSLAQIGFVFRPGTALGALLLVISGLGFAYTLGLDAVLLQRIPVPLRGQGLAVASALPMFTQGLGFAVAGAAAEYIAPSTVIWVGACLALTVILSIGASAHRPPRPARRGRSADHAVDADAGR